MEGHLASRDYLAGQRLTLADLAFYAYVARAPEGDVSLVPYPASATGWHGSNPRHASSRCRNFQSAEVASERISRSVPCIPSWRTHHASHDGCGGPSCAGGSGCNTRPYAATTPRLFCRTAVSGGGVDGLCRAAHRLDSCLPDSCSHRMTGTCVLPRYHSRTTD